MVKPSLRTEEMCLEPVCGILVWSLEGAQDLAYLQEASIHPLVQETQASDEKIRELKASL